MKIHNMKTQHFDTLVEATNQLSKEGFTSHFTAVEGGIENQSDKTICPTSQVKIHFSQRFEGMTNPSDSSQLFALELNDGSRGILVSSYGAKHSQNTETIQKLSESEH